MLMTYKDNSTFDPAAFLAHADLGRRIIDMKPDQTFFAQGDPADSVFYLQSGRAKLTVVSHEGKEAKVTLLSVSYTHLCSSAANRESRENSGLIGKHWPTSTQQPS